MVILRIDSTAFMRSLICFKFFVANPNWDWKRRDEAPCNLEASIIN